MTNKTPLYFVLAMMVALSSLPMLVSCNKDNDKDSDDSYTYSTSEQTTLVKDFGLQADSKVLDNLDSVHFTVDYDKGLIYNADSLPVGTDISSLKVIVEFLNTVKSAVFHISDATVQADTAINYSTSMTQPIDFTGKTLLTVTSADETEVKNYEVKVLVHKVRPDTLIWNQNWRRDLPGYASDLRALKMVQQGDLYRIMTYNGNTCKMLTASAPGQTSWDEQLVDMPFEPQVKTLTATDEALYMLSMDGTLFTSTEGVEWTSCGVRWYTLLGAYEERVLGIIDNYDGSYTYDEYPRQEGFVSEEVPENFPVSHSSNMIAVDNKWALSSQVMIVGGVDCNGNVIKDTWGYDGNKWGQINNIHGEQLPALADATLFSYFTFKRLPGVRRYGRQSTWYLMGGRKSDGSLNNDIYLSNTQGVVWFKSDSTMVQPDYMPDFYGAQAFVGEETMTAPNRVPSRVSSLPTTWQCPYIYLFGGYDADGDLLPYVWRGVYNRLTNTPIY